MLRYYQGVFRSRWRAVLWSAGVLLTAYCTIPSQGEDPAAEILELAGEQATQPAPPRQAPSPRPQPKRVNPWALDKPAG